jgi:hypothetical protein
MLHLFYAAPEQVRWEFTPAENGGSHQIAIHHAHGTVVESFETRELAIRRIQV